VPQRGLGDVPRPLEQRQGCLVVPHGLVERRQVVQAPGVIGVLLPQRGLVDVPRPPVAAFGLGPVRPRLRLGGHVLPAPGRVPAGGRAATRPRLPPQGPPPPAPGAPPTSGTPVLPFSAPAAAAAAVSRSVAPAVACPRGPGGRRSPASRPVRTVPRCGAAAP